MSAKKPKARRPQRKDKSVCSLLHAASEGGAAGLACAMLRGNSSSPARWRTGIMRLRTRRKGRVSPLKLKTSQGCYDAAADWSGPDQHARPVAFSSRWSLAPKASWKSRASRGDCWQKRVYFPIISEGAGVLARAANSVGKRT